MHRTWTKPVTTGHACAAGVSVRAACRLLIIGMAFGLVAPGGEAYTATPTREFEIRGDRAFLGGEPIKVWGIRSGNALHDQVVTERHVRNLDNMAAHGINCLLFMVQGTTGGWPDLNAGRNGYERDGRLKPEFAARLEWLVRELDRRGMMAVVGLFSPRKDDELESDEAVRRAVEETAGFLRDRGLKNLFVDIMHEFNHETLPENRIDRDIFREPDGPAKKARLTAWFNAVAPDIEAGISPRRDTDTTDSYPGMGVRLIQKEMPIAPSDFVANVESQRHDAYENDGVFTAKAFAQMYGDFQKYRDRPNTAFIFSQAWIQGITNKSGSAPHPEMGGYGKSEEDRGVRFYYEWVRDNVGRWEYPAHVRPGGGQASRRSPD